MSVAARPTSAPAAVVFDLDGLLFNTEELYQEVGSELLRRRGKEFTTDLLDQMMGRPGRISLQLMIDWHELDDTVDGLLNETDEIFPAILDRSLSPMPGVLELLAALEAALIPKAIATSSRRAFTQDILARFQLGPRFAFLLTAEDVLDGKPHPEVYLKAAHRLAVPPQNMVVFEDSHLGCRAAVTSGAIAVAVPGGHSHTHDFTGAAFIAESLADPRIYELLHLERR